MSQAARNLRALLNALIHNVLLFLLRITGTPWAHTCSFLLLIIIYEYYEARSAISLESDERIVFTPFSGSQTRNIRSTQLSQSNSFFLALSNEYVNDRQNDPVL